MQARRGNMKNFAACCRACTTEPMLRNGDGPMGKGRHHLISRCVPVSAHLIKSVGGCPPRRALSSCQVNRLSPVSRLYRAKPAHVTSVATSVWGRISDYRHFLVALRASLPFAPDARGVYLKGIFKDGGCSYGFAVTLSGTPVATSKRPFTRRETRLAFSGRFSGLRIFGFQGTRGVRCTP